MLDLQLLDIFWWSGMECDPIVAGRIYCESSFTSLIDHFALHVSGSAMTLGEKTYTHTQKRLKWISPGVVQSPETSKKCPFTNKTLKLYWNDLLQTTTLKTCCPTKCFFSDPHHFPSFSNISFEVLAWKITPMRIALNIKFNNTCVVSTLDPRERPPAITQLPFLDTNSARSTWWFETENLEKQHKFSSRIKGWKTSIKAARRKRTLPASIHIWIWHSITNCHHGLER